MKHGRTLAALGTELQRQRSMRQDFLADTRSLKMTTTGSVSQISVFAGNNRQDFIIRDLAHQQIASRMGIPYRYYQKMQSEKPALLDENVNTWFQHSPERRMVRIMDGSVRAFLSDRYRRLDHLELCAAVLPIINDMKGASIESCEVTETHMYLKVINKRLKAEVTVGDVVQAGFVISNSEVGMGSLKVEPLVYRFITFVAADPNNPETLNNRKTMRQIFAYKPGNGLLLQSRLYNTSGGTYGAQEDSKLYRDLVQREISDLEGAPNLWQTYTYFNNTHCTIGIGVGFGGYADWVYKDFDAKLSIRNDHSENYESFFVGNYGLCIECGCEIDERLYCSDCKEPDEDDSEDESERCEECDEYFNNVYPVHDSNGDEIYVCAGCRDRYYFYCEVCNSYHPKEDMTVVSRDIHVCPDCLERKYRKCEECGEYFLKEDVEDGLCPTCRSAHEEEVGAVA